jgi:hypothetical protein
MMTNDEKMSKLLAVFNTLSEHSKDLVLDMLGTLKKHEPGGKEGKSSLPETGHKKKKVKKETD